MTEKVVACDWCQNLVSEEDSWIRKLKVERRRFQWRNGYTVDSNNSLLLPTSGGIAVAVWWSGVAIDDCPKLFPRAWEKASTFRCTSQATTMEKRGKTAMKDQNHFVKEKLAYLVAYQIKHRFALQPLTLGWGLLAMSGGGWHGEDGKRLLQSCAGRDRKKLV